MYLLMMLPHRIMMYGYFSTEIIEKIREARQVLAQQLSFNPENQRVIGSIPDQGIC